MRRPTKTKTVSARGNRPRRGYAEPEVELVVGEQLRALLTGIWGKTWA